MEEIEVPLEQVHEHIHEQAHHAKESWISRVALATAFLAAFAAVSALMAGHHANEAMIDQIKASDSWSHYQAKSIKAEIVATRTALLEQMGKRVPAEDLSRAEKYKEEQNEISKSAQEESASAGHHLRVHQILARSVTFFQVAIAIAAIAVLTRRKHFFWMGVGFGLVGVCMFCQGLLVT
jgi:hypothetical protein